MPSRCLNPRATNLDFALLIQPSSSDFQLNSHFASITLTIGCYAGPNVWACSRPLNSCALEPSHISACSDASASVMIGGVGRSLAGAVGRSASGFGNACCMNASSTPRGWPILAPMRHGTSDPCCGGSRSSRAFRLAFNQAYSHPPRAPAPEQCDRELMLGGLVAARVRRRLMQAPARRQAWQ